MNNFETQYLNIMTDILDNGTLVENRTGINSLTTWGQQIKVDLSKEFPLVNTRKTALRIAFEETWFFLRGETDTKKLEEKKINIWKGNTTREFLDARGLCYLPEGHMGKGYGFQWRNFGGDYRWHCDWRYDTEYLNIHKQLDLKLKRYDYSHSLGGIDQISELLKGLKNDPTSRRHIVCGWNPAQSHEMSLVPCHLYNQYQVVNGKLNSSFVMRSSDYFFGFWANIASYALLNLAFAKYLKLEPGILVYFGNDVHLYINQIDMAKVQVTRTPFPSPKVNIKKELNSLDDILSMEFSDIELIGYECHPDFTDKPPMAI